MNYLLLGLAIWLFCGLFGWLMVIKLMPFEKEAGIIILGIQLLVYILTLIMSLTAGPITILASWLTKDEMKYEE